MKPFVAIVFFLISSISGYSQVVFGLQSKNQSINNVDFNVIKVNDNRKIKRAEIGDVLISATSKEKVFLQQSFEKSLLNYFAKYNSATRQVGIIIDFDRLELQEKYYSSSRIDGEIWFDITASSVANGDTVKFCNARNKANYSRSLGKENLPNIEKQLAMTLDNGLDFIIRYVAKNKSMLDAFATDSKVIIKPLFAKVSADTVYYQQRKVNWNDFKGQINNGSQYGAAIYSSFGFDSRRYVENNTIIVEIIPKIFTDRNFSWAKPNIKNDYALKHEQLHFDICYLLAMRFLEKSKTFKAKNMDDLVSRVQYEYLEFYRLIHDTQDAYDNETNHSIITEKQAYWQNKISNEIKALDLKNIFN